MGSNHFLIRMLISRVDPSRKAKFVYKLLLSNSQLCDFRASCEADPPLIVEDAPGTDAYSSLMGSIRSHISKYIPEGVVRPRTRNIRRKSHNSPSWWNETCQEAITEKRSALAVFKSCPSSVSLAAYKDAQKAYNRTLRREKKRGWRNLCSSFNFRTPTARIWSLLLRAGGSLLRSQRLITKSRGGLLRKGSLNCAPLVFAFIWSRGRPLSLRRRSASGSGFLSVGCPYIF